MRKIKISQVDAIFVDGSYPIEFLFFYKSRLEAKKIRTALGRLSSDFWPIFGEYDSGMICFDSYSEIDCFDEEVSDQKFDEKETNKNLHEMYCQISPSKMKKLFFLKVIQHKNGTVLIPRMNHLAGDGYSYFYFLSTLAALSLDTHIPFRKKIIRTLYKPHHRRTILREFQFNRGGLEPLQDKGKFTVEVEEISRTVIRGVIRNGASDLNLRISSNDILSAMATKRLAKIQKDNFGEDFQLTIPIDVRKQIKDYGSNFFGNGIMLMGINFKTKDIEELSINEMAVEIRKSLPNITKESYIDYLCGLEAVIARGQMNELRPYDPKRGCLVTNLSKLPVHRLDFGSGIPDLIFPLTIERNSTAILSNKENFVLRFAY
jgi:NRPS condensation-like uncharacterized protein